MFRWYLFSDNFRLKTRPSLSSSTSKNVYLDNYKTINHFEMKRAIVNETNCLYEGFSRASYRSLPTMPLKCWNSHFLMFRVYLSNKKYLWFTKFSTVTVIADCLPFCARFCCEAWWKFINWVYINLWWCNDFTREWSFRLHFVVMNKFVDQQFSI